MSWRTPGAIRAFVFVDAGLLVWYRLIVLRIAPDIQDTSSGRAIHDAVKAALLLVPRFPSVVLEIVVVVPDALLPVLYCMRHEDDRNSQRNLMEFMFDELSRLGLHRFVEDDDKEVAQAKHDADVLDLLRSHPDAHMIGMVRVEVAGKNCWAYAGVAG